MKNYRDQEIMDSCEVCAHAFLYQEYDELNRLYCNYKKNRPPCCSVYLGEEPSDEWNDWEARHRVRRCGICDHFRRRNIL